MDMKTTWVLLFAGSYLGNSNGPAKSALFTSCEDAAFAVYHDAEITLQEHTVSAVQLMNSLFCRPILS